MEFFGLDPQGEEPSSGESSIGRSLDGNDSPGPRLNSKSSLNKTSSPGLNTNFSLNKLQSVFSSFDGEKSDLINSIGFGGLMKIHKQAQISRQLAFWLLRNMDYGNGCLVLRNGLRLRITDLDVNIVLGLPHEGITVAHHSRTNARHSDMIRLLLGLSSGVEIRMDYIESLLVRDYGVRMTTKEKQAFKVAAMLFADAFFLAPKSGQVKVNHAIYANLVETNLIYRTNWSGYVIRALKECSRKVQQGLSNGNKTVNLDCCLILLEVFYLDNLDIGTVSTDYIILPRICDFPYERMKNIISEDRETISENKVVSFGRLKIRPRSQVIYSRGSRGSTGRSRPELVSSQKQAERNAQKYLLSKVQELKTEVAGYKALFTAQIDACFARFEASITQDHRCFGKNKHVVLGGADSVVDGSHCSHSDLGSYSTPIRQTERVLPSSLRSNYNNLN